MWRRPLPLPQCMLFWRICTHTLQSWASLTVKGESLAYCIYVCTCWLTNQILSLKRKTTFQGRQKQETASWRPSSHVYVPPVEPARTAGQHRSTTTNTLNKWLPSYPVRKSSTGSKLRSTISTFWWTLGHTKAEVIFFQYKVSFLNGHKSCLWQVCLLLINKHLTVSEKSIPSNSEP